MVYPSDWEYEIPDVGENVYVSSFVCDYARDRSMNSEGLETSISGISVYDAYADSLMLYSSGLTICLDSSYPNAVCSVAFMQKMIDMIPSKGSYGWYPSSYSAGYGSGDTVNSGEAFVYLEKGYDYKLSDLDIGTLMNSDYSHRYQSITAYNQAFVQTYMQSLILVVFSGISIAIITAFIISSAVRLETQREKRRYGILQALGMSRRQRNLRLAGTALIRAFIAVIAGWGIYILSFVYTNREAISEGESALTVISDYMTNIAKYYISPATTGIMTAILFVVVFGICYESKLGLNRYSLMQMLESER